MAPPRTFPIRYSLLSRWLMAPLLLGARHTVATEPAELDRYVETGLPARAMGRGPDEDPLFFAAPLAAGRRLGRLAAGTAGE